MRPVEPAAPHAGEPLSPAHAAWVTGRELATNAAGLVLGRMRRDRAHINAEYDGTYWKRLLEERPWTRCATLRDFVVPPAADERIATVGGRYVRVSDADYYEYRRRTFCGLVERSAGAGATEIAELGCGYGLNLFSLALSGRWRKLVGYDISANAIQAARAIAEHFALGHVAFELLDATDAPGVARALNGRTVYTYYCLEQLKYSTRQVIANLLGARVERVMHIEPTVELLRLWRPRDLVNYLYIKRRDYQDNLLSALTEFEAAGAIVIRDVRRLRFAPSTRHDPTFVCWEPAPHHGG